MTDKLFRISEESFLRVKHLFACMTMIGLCDTENDYHKTSNKRRVSTFITARCYVERGYATVCRLSVRLSMTFRYRGHIYVEILRK